MLLSANRFICYELPLLGLNASVTEINKGSADFSAIPATQKMHSLDAISPFVVETKEPYQYNVNLMHTFRLLCKTMGSEICLFSKRMLLVKRTLKAQWLLVE